MKVKPNTTSDALKKRLGGGDGDGEPLRQTAKRQQYLEKLARMISKEDCRVHLHTGGAACHPAKDRDYDMDIYLPCGEQEQPATDLPPKLWHLLFQETELFHELGHVLYTSWARFEEVKYDVEDRHRSLFKDLFNAGEDGAIETQLAKAFNIEQDLTVKSANLVKHNDKRRANADISNLFSGGGSADDDLTLEYTVLEAVQIGLLDMGYYDSGRFAEIRDPTCETREVVGSRDPRSTLEKMVPHMESYMADMLSTPDGAKRVDRTKEFWEAVKPYFERAGETARKNSFGGTERPDDATESPQTGTTRQSNELPNEEEAEVHVAAVSAISSNDDDGDGDGDDGGEESSGGEGSGEGQDEDDSGEWMGGLGQGDDSNEEEDGNDGGSGDGAWSYTEWADEDGGQDSEEEKEEGGAAGSADEEQEEDEEADDQDGNPGGSGGGGQGEEDENANTPPGQVSQEELEQMEQELSEKKRDEVNRQDDGDGEDPMEQDAQEYLSALGSDVGGLRKMEVVEAGEYDTMFDHSRWKENQRIGRSLTSTLKAQLQRERETEYRGGVKTGRVDGSRIFQVAAGNTRVFRQKREGDEKDYSCIIVLDRSSSMGFGSSNPTTMEAAENAAVQLAYGLDEVGVDVSVAGMYDDIPSLEIPFGGRVEEYVDRCLTGRNSGGTPLGDMLELALERVEIGDGEEPFMVVITDGKPNDGQEEKYKRLMRESNMKVHGVYVGNASAAERRKHSEYIHRIVYATKKNVPKKVRELARELVH